jgi:hypothetical protein
MSDAVAVFRTLWPRLIRIALILGHRADAEDIVQDALLRWLQVDHAAIIVCEPILGIENVLLLHKDWRNCSFDMDRRFWISA